MNSHYLYLIIDLCCVSIPFIASFHQRIQFYKEWRFAFPAIGITAILFVLWDIYFVRLGIWHFNDSYILGIYIANLPVEEVLFFITIPYACLFLFFSLKFWISPRNNTFINALTICGAAAILFTGFVQIKLLYTSTTFILSSALLIIAFISNRAYLPPLLAGYMVSLIPFFISNGILTGCWIKEPVVIYNNAHNLNIRLVTIPVEDSMYGLSFQLLNFLLYNFFRSKYSTGQTSQKRMKATANL